MQSEVSRDDVIDYVILVEKVSDMADDYKISNFEEDAKEVIKKHKGIESVVEAKVFLCAKIQQRPVNDINSVVERVRGVDNYEELNRIAMRVHEKID